MSQSTFLLREHFSELLCSSAIQFAPNNLKISIQTVNNGSIRRQMDFEVKDHMQLGAALGLMDFEAGAAVAGAKFAYLRGSHYRPARYL